MTRICDDLRVGGAEIADELFGDPGKARAVYPMKDLLGLFWLNGQLAGFASKMRERLENMPAAAAGENAELEDTEATEVRKNAPPSMPAPRDAGAPKPSPNKTARPATPLNPI